MVGIAAPQAVLKYFSTIGGRQEATKLVKGLEGRTYEERYKSTDSFSPEKADRRPHHGHQILLEAHCSS